METLPIALRNELERDAGLVEDAMQAGLSRGRNTATSTYWEIWCRFRQQLGLEPYFTPEDDPVPWLQIFAQRVRDGRLAARGHPVRSGTVADALLFVAQAHTMLGAPDPRKLAVGDTISPRLARQLRGYSKADPPPSRVKPIPLPILHRAHAIALAAGDAESLAATDMMWLAFFFLLRPGEYTHPAENSHPFRIQDVRLWIGDRQLAVSTATAAELLAADFVGLEFTTQKNGTRGEVIGHGSSFHPTACPVAVVVRRLLYLRSINAPPDTFLCAYHNGTTLKLLNTSAITQLLRQACQSLHDAFGFTAADISAKSLRSSGAMALLNERIDRDIIQLIGRWKSDAMLRYLHIQAHTLMRGYAKVMLHGGNYALIPADVHADLPSYE